MIPVALIEPEVDHLTPTQAMWWLRELRQVKAVAAAPGNYPDLRQKLGRLREAVADKTDEERLQAKTLNAAQKLIEARGFGRERLDSPAGVHWSRAEQRGEFVMDALAALYDTPATSGVVASAGYDWSGYQGARGGAGWCFEHSRPAPSCGCAYTGDRVV